MRQDELQTYLALYLSNAVYCILRIPYLGSGS